MTWKKSHLVSFGSTDVIALKEGRNSKVEVIKVNTKLTNYLVFNFLESFLRTFCQVISESIFCSKTVVFSPQNTMSWRSCWDPGKVTRRVAAVVLPSGICGTDRGLPTGAIALTHLGPFPVLAQARAETTALGQSGHSAGGAVHICAWESNPELIKMKSFLLL